MDLTDGVGHFFACSYCTLTSRHNSIFGSLDKTGIFCGKVFLSLLGICNFSNVEYRDLVLVVIHTNINIDHFKTNNIT